MRMFLIIFLSIVIAGLGYYNVKTNPWISVEQCFENPEFYDGKLVARYSEPLIGEIYPDGFQLQQKKAPSIRVYSDTTGLISGKFVGMRALFHKEGYLEAISLHVAKRRRYKMWISVLPAFLVGILLFRYFRWNKQKKWIEVKDHA